MMSAESWLHRLARELDRGAVPLEVTRAEWSWAGWYLEQGCLSVWLDQYLDPEGAAHLAVWYGASRAEAVAIADTLAIPSVRRYTWKRRDRGGRVRAERVRLQAWLLDDWGKSDAYVGKYCVLDAERKAPRAVAGRVQDALLEVSGLASEGGARTRAWVERLARPAQGYFRARLLEVLGKCVISGCSVRLALEAAHITGVAADGLDKPDNGLLLRADLHRLFDAGLLTISGEPRVLMAKELKSSPYGALHGQQPAVVLTPGQLANLRERNKHWTEHGLSLSNTL